MMFSTREQYKDTYKNRLYLKLYEIFTTWGQWFIRNCDMEPIELTEEEKKMFILSHVAYYEPSKKGIEYVFNTSTKNTGE